MSLLCSDKLAEWICAVNEGIMHLIGCHVNRLGKQLGAASELRMLTVAFAAPEERV